MVTSPQAGTPFPPSSPWWSHFWTAPYITHIRTLFSGWQDEDVPLRYEYVYFNDQGAESLFFFGVTEQSAGKLPLGDEKNNFTIGMEIRIIDAFDATAVVNFTVKVRFLF